MWCGQEKKKKTDVPPPQAVNFGWGMETTDSIAQYYTMSWSAGL